MPGALDANGIWQYTESDVAGAAGGGTFSGLLNKLAASTSAVIGSVLSRLTALEARAVLQRTTNQSIMNGGVVVVTYDATDLVNNLGAAFNITRGTGLLVCATAGTYKFQPAAELAANATGVRQLFIQKALAATPTVFVFQTMSQPAASAAAPNNLTLCSFLTLAVGDVVSVAISQSSGAALNLTSAHLEIKKEH